VTTGSAGVPSGRQMSDNTSQSTNNTGQGSRTWISDYHYTDFTQIEADVNAMESFAKKLESNVQSDYNTHQNRVQDLMTVSPAGTPAAFEELVSFLHVHHQAQYTACQNVYYFGIGTTGLAHAASEVSRTYRGSDAFARSRVSDVDEAFRRVSGDDELPGETRTRVSDARRTGES